MTKVECICENFGFVRVPELDWQEEKHNGSLYTIRVWKSQYDGVWFALHCDNYYGRSVLFDNGKRFADIEQRYDQLGEFLERLVALENFGRNTPERV